MNDETRGATDKICRTARSIVQAASDVENYVLKRFPLTLPHDYEEWKPPGQDKPESKAAPPPTKVDKERKSVWYNTQVGHSPALRMRSKAASAMPSLATSALIPRDLSPSMRAALAFGVR